MRMMTRLMVSAMLAAATGFFAPPARALDPDSCGDIEVSSTAQCQVKIANACGSTCDAPFHFNSCDTICGEECKAEAPDDQTGCFNDCSKKCVSTFEGDCKADCSGEGALFCADSDIHVQDLNMCIEYLCSIGTNVEGMCDKSYKSDCSDEPCELSVSDEGADSADTFNAIEDVRSIDTREVTADTNVADEYSNRSALTGGDAPRACSTAPGNRGRDSGAVLVAAVLGLGALMSRRNRS